MIKPSVQVKGADRAMRSVNAYMKRLVGHNRVLVGVQKGAGATTDGTLLAEIAAANHFGAEIDHPGGTSYGYKTKRDAEAGKVRFLKDGQGLMALGETGPHKINIPARPFLDVAIQQNQKKYARIMSELLPKVFSGEMTVDQLLHKLGVQASADVREYMDKLMTPPNAASTIAKKGENNPLVDTGNLKQSMQYEIAREPVEEGL